MQHRKLFSPILFTSCLLLACTGNNTANAGKDSVSDKTATSNISTSGGAASFSCMLDGKKFEESGSSGNINAAFHLTGDSNGQIFFMLADVSDPEQKLSFQIPGKTGNTIISNNPPHFSYEGLVLKGFVTYIDDPVTVNIISISSTRVSGTFTGTYSLENPTTGGNVKKTIEVTEGKFDIPFSTSADWNKLYNAE